jgi:HEAT repeat protein
MHINAFIVIAALATSVPAAAQDFSLAGRPDVFQDQERARERADADRERELARQEREREAAQREREREQRIYEQAQEAMDQGRYDRAVERFNDVVNMKGSRVDAALYWKAYSQHRIGQRSEALATIGELTKNHANSRYVQQAKALEVEVRREIGQPVRPNDAADEELKLYAIQALQNSDPEQGIPMLEKLINGPASPKLKERALFVLAQSNSPRAREIMKNLARGNSTPEVQSRAIQYLGVHGGAENRAILADVYGSSNDVDTKRRILRAFMVSGDKTRIWNAAQSEQNPEVRAEAVRQLGVMGAHEELWQLYQKETAVDVKKRVIEAMMIGGNVDRMIDIAKSEQNPELRRSAVTRLGHMGNRKGAEALAQIYATDKDVAVKKSVIQALFVSDNAATLVSMARKEQDMTLKRDIVEKLSHMDDKVARDYMIELLGK